MLRIFFSSLVFFVAFYRLSFLSPSLYLSFIPGVIGFFYLLGQGRLFSRKLQKPQAVIYLIGVCILIYSIILDILSIIYSGNVLTGLFAFRFLFVIFLSVFPAYFFVYLIKFKFNDFLNVFKICLIIQTLFFLIMFLNPAMKSFIYSIFGMGGSVNLLDHNFSSRGFGLSGEINYMSPFLMMYLVLIFYNNILFSLIIFITQIVNSNMVLISILIGFLASKLNIYFKIILIFLGFLTLPLLNAEFIKNYAPRFYDEYIANSGERTITALSEMMFLVNRIDIYSFLFGFQKNISTGVDIASISRRTDVGWVVMFNYGGIIYIILFVSFIIALSFKAFKDKYLAVFWVLIAILLNSKGLMLGMNGYFFITFVLIFLNVYSVKEKNEF